jgi:hypothetical protein
MTSHPIPQCCEACCYSANFAYGASVCDKGLRAHPRCREFEPSPALPLRSRLWEWVKRILPVIFAASCLWGDGTMWGWNE